MIASVYSVALTGFEGTRIEVETDMKQGLPGIQIVGMGNKAVDEARERIRSAIRHSLLDIPARKYTLNLAPADLPKDGAHFDLALAVSLLVATGQLAQSEVQDAVFAGELSLSGLVKPVRGALSIARAAQKAGIRRVFIPARNAEQVALIKNIDIYPVASLRSLYLHLKNLVALPLAPSAIIPAPPSPDVTFDDITGQEQAKRALTIALAGRHNILLYGPPGVGKTLLAKSSLALLSPLSDEEKVAVTQLHSLTGEALDRVISMRPFRAPHHSTSHSAFIGGGSRPKPGEISLAHHGVLYLDELPEFSRTNLEALRQPLEEKQVTHSRLHGRVTYPADFMLIASMNPCPCGYFGDPEISCRCSDQQRKVYRHKLSGPLLDRFDVVVQVSRPNQNELFRTKLLNENQHTKVLMLMVNATTAQNHRYKRSVKYNSSLSAKELKTYAALASKPADFLARAATRLRLSARSSHSVLKVARTIADLEASPTIEISHISEALGLRGSLIET